jgi:dienelactone hydrolase
VKKLLALIVASMASALVLYGLVSKDRPATHSGLVSAGLPPLISVHELYPLTLSSWVEAPLALPTLAAGKQSDRTLDEFGQRLTLPQTKTNPGPLPAVVLILSEATGMTELDYDKWVQFLANRGYAVLSVDCGIAAIRRGIAADVGYGNTRRCTETSIAEEARELVERGIADPAAMAISGSGTGGTLALMTISAEPDLFKAAVVHSPIRLAADKPDEGDEGDFTGKLIEAELTPAEYSTGGEAHSIRLALQSPVELIRNTQGAIMMTQGDADEVALLDRSLARQIMASRDNVEIRFCLGESLVSSRWQTRVKVARLTETFLARHLGGRNGGYDYIELFAKLF